MSANVTITPGLAPNASGGNGTLLPAHIFDYGTSESYVMATHTFISLCLLLFSMVVAHLVCDRLDHKYLTEPGVIILVGIAAGGVVAAIDSGVEGTKILHFDPGTFFSLYLPPIVFNAGFSMRKDFFFQNLGPILALALVGTAVSTAFVGGLLYLMGAATGSYNMTIEEGLTFGA